jgi:hypothetical protein
MKAAAREPHHEWPKLFGILLQDVGRGREAAQWHHWAAAIQPNLPTCVAKDCTS